MSSGKLRLSPVSGSLQRFPNIAMKQDIQRKVNLSRQLLLQARSHDPFAYLGIHQEGKRVCVRVFKPYVQRAWLYVDDKPEEMKRSHPDGLYEWVGESPPQSPYRIKVDEFHEIKDCYDAYAFPPQISGHDLHLFNEGRLLQAYRMLGSHAGENRGVAGVRFAVWAPNAERVSVIGNFNRWDGRVHQMMVHGSSGVWELFIPGLRDDILYKYEIRNTNSELNTCAKVKGEIK